jgi:hypothetical protein
MPHLDRERVELVGPRQRQDADVLVLLEAQGLEGRVDRRRLPIRWKERRGRRVDQPAA